MVNFRLWLISKIDGSRGIHLGRGLVRGGGTLDVCLAAVGSQRSRFLRGLGWLVPPTLIGVAAINIQDTEICSANWKKDSALIRSPDD